MAPYREEWLQHVDDLSATVRLDVAGYTVTVDLTPAQLREVYLPLLATLADRTRGGDRVVAGLAGVPGGGKSTLAAVLAHVAGRVLPPGEFAVVGMDGWHLPNVVLDRRTTRDAAGKVVPLRQRKGCPESFDATGLATALRELHPADQPVSLPVYDRQRHDPAADALTIEPRTRIVLVEGNYLLSDTPPWNEVCELLHPRLLLECDVGAARERVIARHIRGGLGREQATAKYEANDRRNTEMVLSTSSRADIVIRLEPGPGVRWLKANG